MLYGIVRKQAVDRIIASVFPQKRGESVKRMIDGAATNGKPTTCLLEDYANDYERRFPKALREAIDGQIDLIAGFLDALAAARRKLTPDEAEDIANGRDAIVMGTLNGEPVQVDIFHRYLIVREDDETLGQAFERLVGMIDLFAQMQADMCAKTLHVFVERYATDRNLRDVKLAEEFGMPLSAVGLMSPNICAIVVTDTPKAFKGLVARCATYSPVPGRKRAYNKARAQEMMRQMVAEN